MTAVNDEFIERYQKIWEADQSSKVFAPLAEAYRRSGNLQRALQTCRQGLNLHPSFAGGWYQLAKVYVDRQESEKAVEALKKAVSLAPENIQAHTLMADLYLTLRQPKEALKAFKMVLLLNPSDLRAQKTIERLESLTADEYDSETFEFNVSGAVSEMTTNIDESESSENDSQEDSDENHSAPNPVTAKLIQQTVTLVDALLVRNEFTKARDTILKAMERFGSNSELHSRLSVIEQQSEKSFEDDSPEIIQPVPPRNERIRLLKVQKLQNLLERLAHRSQD